MLTKPDNGIRYAGAPSQSEFGSPIKLSSTRAAAIEIPVKARSSVK